MAVAVRFLYGLPVSRLRLRSHFRRGYVVRTRFGRELLGASRGGDEQNRTVDPLLARQVLSQLSYTPIFPTGLPLLVEYAFHHL